MWDLLLREASGYESLRSVAEFYKNLQPDYPEPSAWAQSGWARIDYANTTTTRKFSSLRFDNLTSSIDRSDLMLGDGFNISQDAVVSISSYFQSTFATSGMAYLIENASAPGHTFQALVNGYRISDTQNRAKSTPSILRMLFDSPDLDATFRSLARSMSNAIRAGSDDSRVQTGRSGTTETLYRIEWGYVVTHCVVVISGSTFLVLTVYKNRRQKVPVWKSNALAVLLYGPLFQDPHEGL
ncbi:hypothetical protein MMC27_008364 [Neofusicoccum parvum]|nr:hypothetical protein MMC27_008364 [Neofusicoccum parvum]